MFLRSGAPFSLTLFFTFWPDPSFHCPSLFTIREKSATCVTILQILPCIRGVTKMVKQGKKAPVEIEKLDPFGNLTEEQNAEADRRAQAKIDSDDADFTKKISNFKKSNYAEKGD
ncbi:MAG: hypothetical protein AAF423_05680 [Pseudomonadota bacterium]